MALPSSLAELLARARQRSLAHLLLHQLVLTAAIVLAGAAVILLAGTEAVSWFWLIPLGAASLALGLYLSRKRFLSTYETAQHIDARLHLADTLSTAAFFADAPGAADESIREAQRVQAGKMAESVDLKTALPLKRPQALYPALVLAAVVAGIFLLRYSVLGSFDPHAPLVQSAFDNLFRPTQQQAKAGGQPEDGNQPSDRSEDNKEAAKNNDFAGEPTPEPIPALPRRRTTRVRSRPTIRIKRAITKATARISRIPPRKTTTKRATSSRRAIRTPRRSRTPPCSTKSAKRSTTC